jgi:hypothetical protein
VREIAVVEKAVERVTVASTLETFFVINQVTETKNGKVNNEKQISLLTGILMHFDMKILYEYF